MSITWASCQAGSVDKEYQAQFDKLYNAGFGDDYSYVSYNPDSSQVFIFSSMLAPGLRYNVARRSLMASYPNILIEKSGRYVSFALADKEKYCLVEDNFDARTLATSLLVSKDYGQNWNILSTPVEFPRSSYFIGDSSIIVEGDLAGTGQVFLSGDNGKNWRRISNENRYKTVYLLSVVDNRKVLCMASKTFDEKMGTLAIYSPQDNSFTELSEVNNSTFKLPISADRNLYCICGRRKIIVFKVNSSKYEEVEELPIPDNIDLVDNVYLNDGVCIITGSSYEVGDESKSWISFNNGDEWEPFFQDRKMKLVYNNGSRLLVEDNANDVFECKLSW